jgi:hypothetical protein
MPSVVSSKVSIGAPGSVAGNNNSSAQEVTASGWLRTSFCPLLSQRAFPSHGRQTLLLASGSHTSCWPLAPGHINFK